MTWQLPWGTCNPWVIVSAVLNNERLTIPSPEELPGPEGSTWPHLDRYVGIMQRCWAQNPKDRPKFEEIMQELRLIDPEATEAH